RRRRIPRPRRSRCGISLGWAVSLTQGAPMGPMPPSLRSCRPFSRLLATCFVAVVGAVAAAFGGAERPPRVEDQARAMALVPGCITPLPGRAHGGGATMRNLKEEQYWQLVFPSYDAKNHRLPLGALTCTGSAVFSDPVLAGGQT